MKQGRALNMTGVTGQMFREEHGFLTFLRTGLGGDNGFTIRGNGLFLRPPRMSDYTAWAELRAASRTHLVPWEPAWPRDELTRAAYRRRLRHYQRESREDLGYVFLLFDTANNLLGGLSLSNVRRGAAQSASLGYWVGLPYAGKGVMTEAVRTVKPFAFGTLGLHRLEAAVMPANAPSIRVLENNGFMREGLAQRYLKINGVWQDHILFALLAGNEKT